MNCKNRALQYFNWFCFSTLAFKECFSLDNYGSTFLRSVGDAVHSPTNSLTVLH